MKGLKMGWKVPELDAITHEQLEVWIGQASRQHLWKAILAGREWRATSPSETEADNKLINAVEERLEMLELAYSAREE
jgi:hypothetical protein